MGPTARIVSGLGEHDWVPVDVEEQRIHVEARRGFQKHMIRFPPSRADADAGRMERGTGAAQLPRSGLRVSAPCRHLPAHLFQRIGHELMLSSQLCGVV